VLGLALGLLSLATGEGIARALEPARAVVPTGSTFMRPHPTRGWSMSPGTVESAGVSVEIDAAGLRACPPAASPLLLTLGDSSIFGHGLADSDTLHGQLGAATGGAFRACTAAVPGYSSLQTRVFLDEQGWAMGPAVLVIGNQWSDNQFDYFPDATLLGALGGPSGGVEAVLIESALYRFLAGVLGRPTTYSVYWKSRDSWGGVRRVPLDQYADNLRWMLGEARSRGVGVVFLTLANRRTLQHESVHEPWTPYVAYRAALAQAAGVPIVDATPILRASGEAVDALFMDEMHPTALANRLVAAELAGALAPGPVVPGVPAELPLPRDIFDEGPLDPRSLQERLVRETAPLEGR